MFSKISSILKDLFNENTQQNLLNQQALCHKAIAGLLCEVASADHHLDEKEESIKKQMLCVLLHIDDTSASQLLKQAQIDAKSSVSLFEYTDKLRQLDTPQRAALIKAMWEVAFANDQLDPMEESIIRKTADLLYLDQALFIKAKLDAQTSMDAMKKEQPPY